MNRKSAFTLSEVLITLAIIGVIAAITIPVSITNSQDEAFRSALKKSISGLNQALALEFALEGYTAQDYSSAQQLVENVFKRRMNVIDGRTDFTSDVCGGSVFTTGDGVIFCVDNYSSGNSDSATLPCNIQNTTPCIVNNGANVWIDVNGVKKPNRLTELIVRPKDIYQAQIYSQKVIPYGDVTQGFLLDTKILPPEDNNTEPDDNDNSESGNNGGDNPNKGPGNNSGNGNTDPGNGNNGNDNPNKGPGNNNGNGNGNDNPNKGPGNNNGNGNGNDNPNKGPGNNNGNGNGNDNPNKGPGNNNGKKNIL